MLGHRLLDLDRRALVKAYDVRLTQTTEGWEVRGVDVHKHRWFAWGSHENYPARDWLEFLPLVGKDGTYKTGFGFDRILGLKPAQIADILELASAQEREILLEKVHSDPELEADVFEELEDDKQGVLLESRSNEDVAHVLSRMRADDVADAIMELSQDRRRKVLDLLPQPQGRKVLALLGYNDATAGGLMGTDYLALPEGQTVGDALRTLQTATTQQPEALTTIYSLRPDGTLAGSLHLVRALQIPPTTVLSAAVDADPVAASPSDDVIAVTTLMADYNLLTLPVLDQDGRILGIVTVDDALEAAIPRDWMQRERRNGPRKMQKAASKTA